MRKRSRVMNVMTEDQVYFHMDHIDQYLCASNAATGSKVDENANMDTKTIASLRGDSHKTEDIQINRRIVQEQLVKTFGPGQGRRLAKQYLRDLEDHVIYTHDETALVTPYTYGPHEVVSVEYKGASYTLPLEDVYQMCTETEEELDPEEGVWVKYPDDLYVQDIKGKTQVSRLVQKKRHRDLVRVKTAFGEDLIVTDNHPMIISDDASNTVDAVDCEGQSQLRPNTWITFNNRRSLDMASWLPGVTQTYNDYCVSQRGPGKAFTYFKRHIELTSELGYFVGFFIGDGNYHYSSKDGELVGEIVITQKDKLVLQRLADMLYSTTGVAAYITHATGVRKCWKLKVRSRELVMLLSSVFGIPRGSHRKLLPTNITSFTEEFALGVLSGLLDSDGIVSKGSGLIKLSSRSAIQQATAILHYFGYTGGNQHQATPFSNNDSYDTNYDIWGVSFNKTSGCPELPHSFKARSLVCKDQSVKYTPGWSSVTSVTPVTSERYLESCDLIYDITTESSTFVCNGLWVHNCAAITLAPMLEHGTRPLGGKSGPPKHLTSYIGQVINTIFCVSSQVAGAVGVPEFLIHFDSFARHDWGHDYLETHKFDVSQAFQTFLYTINEPAGSRNGQCPFVNVSIFDKNYFDALFADSTVYPTMPDIKPNWGTYNRLQEYFLDMVRDENRKEVVTFPIKTATVLHDGEKPLDPDFADMIADDLSKGSQMFLYLSTSVDSLSSCCRLRNDLDVNDFSNSLGAGGVSTGSLNVITLNLNRIVQDNKNLKSIVDRVHKYQVAHRKIFERFADAGMYPIYSAGYIDMDRQYLTIGFNGMVEAAESQGIPANYNPDYIEFVDKILRTISDANKVAAKEYGYKINMEQVPAEGLGIKNAKWDRKDGYRVPRDCYNSYMFPVEDPKLSVGDKLRLHGGEVCKHCDGGQACHINLEEHPGPAGYKTLINLAIKTGCQYLTTNVLRTSCGDCNHVEFEKTDKCVACGSENISYATRIIGYLKKIPAFSEGRQKEAAIRAYSSASEFIEQNNKETQ